MANLTPEAFKALNDSTDNVFIPDGWVHFYALPSAALVEAEDMIDAATGEITLDPATVIAGGFMTEGSSITINNEQTREPWRPLGYKTPVLNPITEELRSISISADEVLPRAVAEVFWGKAIPGTKVDMKANPGANDSLRLYVLGYSKKSAGNWFRVYSCASVKPNGQPSIEITDTGGKPLATALEWAVGEDADGNSFSIWDGGPGFTSVAADKGYTVTP